MVIAAEPGRRPVEKKRDYATPLGDFRPGDLRRQPTALQPPISPVVQHGVLRLGSRLLSAVDVPQGGCLPDGNVTVRRVGYLLFVCARGETPSRRVSFALCRGLSGHSSSESSAGRSWA